MKWMITKRTHTEMECTPLDIVDDWVDAVFWPVMTSTLSTHFHSGFLSQRGIQLLIQTGFIDLTVSPSLSTSTPSSGNTTCIPGGLTAGGLGNTSQRTSTTSSSSSASANGSTSSASSSGQTTSSGVSTSSSSPSTTIGNTTLPPPDVTHQELLASSVAHFLASRKGLSKQKIGEYLGNLQNPFNQLVLDFFVQEVDLSNLTIDEALRKVRNVARNLSPPPISSSLWNDHRSLTHIPLFQRNRICVYSVWSSVYLSIKEKDEENKISAGMHAYLSCFHVHIPPSHCLLAQLWSSTWSTN